MRIKIAAIAKNEGAYLPQWIFHHYKFGVREFEVWVNQSTDDSLEILNRIKQLPDISLIVVEADEFFEECRLKNKYFQLESYRKIWSQSQLERFDYLFFLDVDEFWTPKNMNSTLESFLIMKGMR